MKILYSPQVAAGAIDYAFAGDTLKATIGAASDTFDFTGLPDGEAAEIVTTLPVRPVLRAYRAGGVLHVVLLRWIREDATEAECWPTWQEV